MRKIWKCEFNMDTACVELLLDDGTMIAIDTIAVENEVADNMYQRSELDWLIYNRCFACFCLAPCNTSGSTASPYYLCHSVYFYHRTDCGNFPKNSRRRKCPRTPQRRLSTDNPSDGRMDCFDGTMFSGDETGHFRTVSGRLIVCLPCLSYIDGTWTLFWQLNNLLDYFTKLKGHSLYAVPSAVPSPMVSKG